MINKKHINILSVLFVLFLTSCYTYNIPSGANTPLITKEKEFKISANANFEEIGGNFSYGLTEHVVFSSSGNYILSHNAYKQDYDSVFFKKNANNFEVSFGYFGGKNKFANMLLFGVGAGNDSYKTKNNNYFIDGYFTEEYYQANFIQYFLQYTAGFKYEKQRSRKKKYKELGISLRYAYHNYDVIGITRQKVFKNIYNNELGNYESREYETSSIMEEKDFFNSFSIYYFYRTGNDKLQFEVSPGVSFYDKKLEYKKNYIAINNIHFNVGIVLNINNLISQD